MDCVPKIHLNWTSNKNNKKNHLKMDSSYIIKYMKLGFVWIVWLTSTRDKVAEHVNWFE